MNPKREDFCYGSMAAAAGGVTTVISAAPPTKPIRNPKDLQGFIEEGTKKSLIDFSFHAGNMNESPAWPLNQLTASGITSFAIFSGPIRKKKIILQIMKEVKDARGVLIAHAKDGKKIEKNFKRLLKEGRTDIVSLIETFPNEAEEKAVKRIVKLALRVGCNLHLPHITVQEDMGIVKKAKSKRSLVTAEACPIYLIFTKEEMVRRGAKVWVDPPLRGKKDLEALWEAIDDGVIDVIASHHLPCTESEKDISLKDPCRVPAGTPEIETMLPLMLSEGVGKGRLKLERLIEVLSAAPARIFGLYPQKGAIREGGDADLVIINMNKKITIQAEKLHYKVGWTPYEGLKVKGVPTTTISRGEIIMDNGEIIGKAGRGKFLARPLGKMKT
jgi:dihydroorotase (multifunctional complex type)